jgi:hypothetical protein
MGAVPFPFWVLLTVRKSWALTVAIKLVSPETRTVNHYFYFVVYNVTDLLVRTTYCSVLVTF